VGSGCCACVRACGEVEVLMATKIARRNRDGHGLD
jgi:hypothetical protein